MIFLAGRAVVTTKHPRMSTGAGAGGDTVEALDAAEAATKLAVRYTQIDLPYEEAAMGNRAGRSTRTTVTRNRYAPFSKTRASY